eukprot:CAMPEP_0172330628 /NCGR_PEP_ID=MMETSP1058-20130122/61502_1 /TAXON_ID=83371 /ORGANISM="Detonula confervacea, Strain CCMP 353" /LENGTH=459 /DNA_ID=CAMNT_0013047851 /DNA_START=283 /DNA_END=1661 /DNA_ORIENTATION=+
MRFSSNNRRNSSHDGDGDGRRRQPRETFRSSSSSNSTQSASYRNHLNGKRKKKKRRPIVDNTIYKRAIILWVIGIILIETFFFLQISTHIDEALLRGRSDQLLDNFKDQDEGRQPPMPRGPPPPKQYLLPKKVITVLGPESSGTTFLSTTLGVAVGAFTKDGGWVHTPAWAFSHIATDDHDQDHRVHRQYHPKGRWTYEKDIGRRAMSLDGEWEIQHLSLPWGWLCEEDEDINIVEALVPEECFRYERDPHLHPVLAEKLWYSTIQEKHAYAKKLEETKENTTDAITNDSGNYASEKANLAAMCRDELKISKVLAEDSTSWTCGAKCGAGKYDGYALYPQRFSVQHILDIGAKCGTGKYDGYALYPQRFSVNITSHIEWYLSRGVDIKVILSMRDRTISSRGKLKGHCHLADVGKREDEVALSLMADAIEKYGKRGSRRGSLAEDVNGKERVIAVSYEG